MDIEEAKKNVKYARDTGFLMSVLTLALSLLSLTGQTIGGVSPWNVIDAIFIAGLAFGIGRYSRICAVLLLVYLFANVAMRYMEAGQGSGWGIAFVFAYFIYQGIRGTFSYHKLKKSGSVPPIKDL
jgi:uncharacterized membrane protein YczE